MFLASNAISSSTVTLISNLILLSIFILTLISCLFGLKKGLIKSTLKFVVWIILLIVVFANNINFAKSVYNLNLTGIINTLQKNFNISNSVIINDVSIPLTQKIGDIVVQALDAMDIAASQDVVKALAISIISYFTLIINLLLCLIISPILNLILYLCLVRPIFKKILKDKKKRMPIGGLCINGLKTLLVACAFFMPLSVSAEILISNYNDAKEDGYQFDPNKSNQYWNVMYPLINGYNSSILHYFFSAITGQGSFNSFYSVNYEKDVNVNFLELFGDFFSVACSTLSVAEDVSQSALISALLTDNTLDLLTEKILNNAFIAKGVLPIVSSIGLNAIANSENAIISKEDADELSQEIGNIDFGEDLSSYVSLVKILNEKGYLTNSFVNNSFNYEFSRENQAILNRGLVSFKDAQNKIKNSGKKTLLDVVLPPVLASLVKNQNKSTSNKRKANDSSSNSFLSILPDNAEEYRKYDLIEFVQVISDVVFNLSDMYKSSDKNPNEEYLSISNFESISSNFMDLLFSSKYVIDGVNDSSNNELSIKTIDLLKGRTQQNNIIDKGLLDAPLILNSISKVVDFALSNLETDNGVFSSDVLDSIKASVKNIPQTKDSWSTEFDCVFKFVSSIYNNPDLPILMTDENGNVIQQEIKINLQNDNQIDALKKAISYIGDSKLIPSIMEPIVKNGVDVDWNNIGINKEDLNFTKFSKNHTLATELTSLLDALKASGPILEMDNNDNIFNLDLTSYDLKEIFNNLIDCEIINPSVDLVSKEKNVLRQLFLHLFSQKSMSDVGINVDEALYDTIGLDKVLFSKEIDKICNIFDVLNERESIKNLLDSSNEISLNSINGDDLEALLNAIVDSDLLRPSLGNILDKQVSATLEEAGINKDLVKFNYIDELDISKDDKIIKWKKETHNFNLLICDIKSLLNKNGNIDFNNLDGSKLNDLITHMSESNILRPSLSTLLENKVGELLTNAGINIEHINFKYVDNTATTEEEEIQLWSKEASCIGNLYDYIENLKDDQGNLSFDNASRTDVENLINNMATSNIFRPSISYILEEKMTPILNQAQVKAKDVDFFYVEKTSTSESEKILKWSQEASEFGQLLDNINSIKGENENIDFNNIEGSDLKSLISNIADSNILRPALTNVIKTELGQVLSDSGINKDYFEFDYIDKNYPNEDTNKKQWKEEAITLGNLLDNVKDLKNADGKVDFNDLITNSENKELFKQLLNNLASLKMLSSEYYENDDASKENKYDRFGLVLLSFVKEALPEYINETDTNYIQIKKDFSLSLYKDNYLPLNKSNENNITLNRNDIWNKQIIKLTDAMFSLNDLKDTNGNISIDITDVSNVTKVKKVIIGDNNSLALNDVDILRTILANIMKKSLNTVFDGTNQTFTNLNVNDSLINTDSFFVDLSFNGSLNEYAKEFYSSIDLITKTSRDVEIETRKIEFDNIFKALELMFDNSDLFETSNVKVEEVKPFFNDLLNSIHESITLHKPKLRDESNKLTLFENVILSILDKSGISKFSNSSDSKSELKNKILSISQIEISNGVLGVKLNSNSKLTWEKEISNLNNIINNESVIKLLDNNILSSNTDKYEEIDNSDLKSALCIINKSYLSHHVISYVNQKFYDSFNLNSYRIDDNEINTKLNYNLDDSFEYFDEQCNVWDDEIEIFIDIKENISYQDETTGKIKIIDIESYDFINDNKIEIQKLLPIIHKSKVMKPMFYDFLYNILNSNATFDTEKLVSSIFESNVSEYNDYRFEYKNDLKQAAKQRRDTLKFLGNEKIDNRDLSTYNNNKIEFIYSDCIDKSWEYEGYQLDNLLKLIAKNDSLSADGDLTDDQIQNIVNLFDSSYEYQGTDFDYSSNDNLLAKEEMVDSNNYYRGYITSELMLNIFDSAFKDLNVTLFSDVRYDYSYKCFNDYEYVALNNILKLKNTFKEFDVPINTSNAITIAKSIVEIKTQLKNILNSDEFIYLGPGNSSNCEKRDGEYKLLNDGLNSNIAVQLIENGYLEKALKESKVGQEISKLGGSFDNVFSLDNDSTGKSKYSIEYHAKVIWQNRIDNMFSN